MKRVTSINFAGAACGLLMLAAPGAVHGQSVSLVASPLVDHPVASAAFRRSPHAWRSGVGAWGENLAEEMLRLRGYNEVHTVKSAGNQGIDRIAIRRTASGQIVDIKFVEVKTSRSSKLRLSDTKHSGRQMSRKWLADHLRAAYRSGDDRLKDLSREIRRFATATGRPLESLGEIAHINTRTGTYRRLASDGNTELSAQQLERLLVQVRRRSASPDAKGWAAQSLVGMDPIRITPMSRWVSPAGTNSRAVALANLNTRTSAVALRRVVLREGRGIIIGRLLTKSAGRLSVVIALAADVKDVVDTENAFRSGKISRRDRNVRHVTTAGGIAGAWGGAAAGSATGGAIGLAGGPFAWFTVPAGAFAGGAIGGIGGYFAGSAAASYAAGAWYDVVDRDVRDRAELQLIAMPIVR